MRPTLSFTTTALLLAGVSSAQPTRSARAEVPLGSGIPGPVAAAEEGTKIRLHRRGSAELTREDGAVDFNRAHVS